MSLQNQTLSVNENKLNFQIKIFSVLFAIVSLLLLISIITYKSADDSIGQIVFTDLFKLIKGDPEILQKASHANNFLGIFGVYISDFLINGTIGYSIVLLPIISLFWAFQLFKKNTISEELIKTSIFFTIVSILFSTLMGIFVNANILTNSGKVWCGVSGMFLSNLLTSILPASLWISVIIITLLALFVFALKINDKNLFTFLKESTSGFDQKIEIVKNKFEEKTSNFIQTQETSGDDYSEIDEKNIPQEINTNPKSVKEIIDENSVVIDIPQEKFTDSKIANAKYYEVDEENQNSEDLISESYIELTNNNHEIDVEKTEVKTILSNDTSSNTEQLSNEQENKVQLNEDLSTQNPQQVNSQIEDFDISTNVSANDDFTAILSDLEQELDKNPDSNKSKNNSGFIPSNSGIKINSNLAHNPFLNKRISMSSPDQNSNKNETNSTNQVYDSYSANNDEPEIFKIPNKPPKSNNISEFDQDENHDEFNDQHHTQAPHKSNYVDNQVVNKPLGSPLEFRENTKVNNPHKIEEIQNSNFYAPSQNAINQISNTQILHENFEEEKIEDPISKQKKALDILYAPTPNVDYKQSIYEAIKHTIVPYDTLAKKAKEQVENTNQSEVNSVESISELENQNNISLSENTNENYIDEAKFNVLDLNKESIHQDDEKIKNLIASIKNAAANSLNEQAYSSNLSNNYEINNLNTSLPNEPENINKFSNLKQDLNPQKDNEIIEEFNESTTSSAPIEQFSNQNQILETDFVAQNNISEQFVPATTSNEINNTIHNSNYPSNKRLEELKNSLNQLQDKIAETENSVPEISKIVETELPSLLKNDKQVKTNELAYNLNNLREIRDISLGADSNQENSIEIRPLSISEKYKLENLANLHKTDLNEIVPNSFQAKNENQLNLENKSEIKIDQKENTSSDFTELKTDSTIENTKFDYSTAHLETISKAEPEIKNDYNLVSHLRSSLASYQSENSPVNLNIESPAKHSPTISQDFIPNNFVDNSQINTYAQNSEIPKVLNLEIIKENPQTFVPNPSIQTDNFAIEQEIFVEEEHEFIQPDMSLLKEADQEHEVNWDELKENAKILQEKLETFKIYIENLQVTPGPVVTQYEFVPAAGIKISRIESLSDDLAMALKAKGIRIIAPVPGKGTVGIEIPNKNPSLVRFSNVVESDAFYNCDMQLPIGFGKTITGEIFMADLAKMPHLLIAGSTGSGKSVGVNTIICSLLYKKRPDELKLAIIDPKMVELQQYSALRHHFSAASPDIKDLIITNPPEAVLLLKSCVEEMENRYALLAKAGQRNILDYNRKVEDGTLKPKEGLVFNKMPYIVVIVDEFADLMMTSAKEVEDPIARLAAKARAVGIHLVLATQRPSVDVITGVIKANFPARIAYLVASKIDSRTILDMTGADQLLGNGDMLYLPPGSPKPIRIQNAYISTDEVENICDFIGDQPGNRDPYMLPSLNKGRGISGVAASDRDDLFEEAARMVIVMQSGSASMLQRKLKIGFARAGRIMDELEACGVVAAGEGSKPRTVLMESESELEAIL